MITLKNVNKTYKTKSGEVVAVKDVNLEVGKGEIFGIIGYSGAGKSTMVRLFNGLEKPTSGDVVVADNNIGHIKGEQLRKARQEIGMIFQHFNLLWSRTVRDNISFPLEIAGVPKKERQKRAEELIKLVGLEGREKAYPSQLSGGQKQRVGIARALANNPKVLLCDEATSALDPQTTDSILDLLVDINKKLGLTIVLITHEMHVIRKICHRVAVMESGNIVEHGEVLEVFRNPQQNVTKRFVKQVAEAEDASETISTLVERYKSGRIVQLTFIGDDAEQPLITQLIRKFDIAVNIVQGKVSQLQDGAYGTLFIHLDGNEEELNKALAFLQQENIEVEVINHV
ncbi:methionine ABC transporter ATP-binding protein [Priestia endophytica]|jgi:D-methionine transport system ATP-binding protein|uniref:Methionine ABC transporter ATP-binding protein n=2 Tax=Priestia endophytica TaxID=135735 RepID=A0AAX1Q633_9BACI|nr:methionine ABC transporter ATP-binding protein [Priestia endophytica]KAB2492278.1 methionine ABC transporter ATP-binding protein [Priestia endophytica]KYG28365.1 methionine ABC transporter ATP-binding protein [Priestia endophytica]MBG9810577.1 methionine ABC transporter ATP-binding protein [Priestia endophytica]MED4071206.1 methionine ABC transporter ATP-binding protein [Priestia endophytica]RAS74722.1 methionine ABC transporter ATP-binding protein [Priestia endophytica]